MCVQAHGRAEGFSPTSPTEGPIVEEWLEVKRKKNYNRGKGRKK